MSLPDRNEEEARVASASEEALRPGRAVIALRWALVVGAALLATFSVARGMGLLASAAPSGDSFACPMHPEVTSGEPGLCPACNMRLERRTPAAPLVAAGPSGIATVPVRLRPRGQARPVPATIAVPDGRRVSVSARSQGWIGSLPVAEVGRRVSRGQVLAMLDSPDLFRLQQKFLNASRWSRAGAPNIQPSHDGDSTGDLVGEARLQLSLAGLCDGDIAAIGAAGRPRREVAVRAPMDGVVLREEVERGGFVAVGQELFAIADLSSVWAVAEVPEGDVARLRVGGAARVLPPAGAAVDGSIGFIAPIAAEGSRTVRVRVEVPNPDGSLRPGMSAVVQWIGASALVPVVPATSLVEADGGPVVFVDRGGRREARAVVLGARVEGDIEIVSGLEAGESVVREGAFSLEAESRLRAARPGP